MPAPRFLREMRFTSAHLAWSLNPVGNNWNFAGNWTPATIPNAPTDTATFGVSNNTAISAQAAVTVVGAVFNSGANAFTITTGAYIFTISGVGVRNTSGVTQTFVVPDTDATSQFAYLNFTNGATAGSLTTYIANNTNAPIRCGGHLQFFDSSTAGSATIVVSGNGDPTHAGSPATAFFTDNATASRANITNMGVFGPASPPSGSCASEWRRAGWRRKDCRRNDDRHR